MVRRKQRRRRASDDDIDPMAGTTNLVDAMLVLALGFLIFVVISWNMQSVIFSDMSQDQKQAVMESMKQVSEVTQGQELNDTPDTSQSSGQGFTELGKVYKDPSSGKKMYVRAALAAALLPFAISRAVMKLCASPAFTSIQLPFCV